MDIYGENKDNMVTYGSLEFGDCFKFCGGYYIKIFPIFDSSFKLLEKGFFKRSIPAVEKNLIANAISLTDGLHKVFAQFENVTKLEAVIHDDEIAVGGWNQKNSPCFEAFKEVAEAFRTSSM